VKACERFGRWDLDSIAASLQETKTREEVDSYSKAFWKKGEAALPQDWARILTNIEKGEAKLRRREEMTMMLADAVESCDNTWWKLSINYTGGKGGKIYTQEEDQFILFMTHKLGYGNWDLLKQEIRRSWQFRFDWFFKSRTPQELARRCDTLIKMLEKADSQTTTARHSGKGSGKSSSKKASSSASSSGKRTRPTNSNGISHSSSSSKRRRTGE